MDFILFTLALCSATLFALALVLTQFGLRSLPPLTGASISIPASAALFAVASAIFVDFSRWHGTSTLIFAMAGAIFPVAVTLLTFESNRQIGPIVTGALGNLAPLFAVGLSVVLIGEIPRTLQVMGAFAIFIGAASLYSGRSTAFGAASAWAFAIPIAAALLRGLVQPVVKLGLDGWQSPLAAATIGYLVSACIVIVLRLSRTDRPLYNMLPGVAWFCAVGLCNGGAVLAMYAALARGPVVVVAPLVALYPLATLLLDMLVHRRSVSSATLIGVPIIVAGVALLLAA
jgi:drug/metabolite transporter (DMT)-like permease